MKTTSSRARSLACALLATTAYCGLTAQPAAAQQLIDYPAEQPSVDQNGVDLVSGGFTTGLVEGSIGSGEQALSLNRYWTSAGWRDNWSGDLRTVVENSQVVAVLTFGSHSDKFIKNGTAWTPKDANGATLTESVGIYTYTAADGTVITFSGPKAENEPGWVYSTNYCGSTGGSATDCALPRSIAKPNGLTTSLHWDERRKCLYKNGQMECTIYYRLIDVRNNAGYAIKIGHQSDSSAAPPAAGWGTRTNVKFINLGIDSCAANAVTCTLTQTAPTVSYAYPTSGVVTVTDPVSREWRFTTSSTYPFVMTGIRRPGVSSDTTSVSYSGSTVTSVTREGVATSYSRSVSGSTATTTVTNALSHQSTVVADLSKGRITSMTDPLSRTTGFDYDTYGRLYRATAPEGNYTELTYDGRGNVTQTTAVAKAGSGFANIVAAASFPSTCSNVVTCNKPTSTTDARGNTTDYTYDSTHGGLLTVTLPAPTSGATRPQKRVSYSTHYGYYKDFSGNVVASTQPIQLPIAVSECQTGASCTGTSDETKTTTSYGPQSAGTANNLLPVSVSSGDGAGGLTVTSAMTYDAQGNLLTVDGPLSGTADTVRHRYNAARELVGTVGPDPDGGGTLKHRALRNTIDATTGLLTKVDNGTVDSQSDSDWAAFTSLKAVETGYDGNARPTTSKLTSGGTTYALTQISYDPLGRPECMAERMNPSEFASLPSDACTLDTQGSDGPDRITKTIYDAAGQVTQVKTAFGVTGEEANEVTSTYTNNGRVQTVTDAESNKTTYVYDGHDRLSQTQFPNSTKGAGTSNSSDYEQLGYDANFNVTSRRNRAGETASYTFDALNRLTLKDLPGSEPDVTYTYDLLGNLTGASQTGHALTFTYDALGRRLTETGPRGTVTSAWDLAGRRTRITHPDSFYVDQDYFVTGEVEKIRENGATSGVGVLATLAYDNLGRRTTLTRGNGTSTSYSYDAVSRLSQLSDDSSGTTYDQVLTFTYNPASQIASSTRSNDLYAWAGHGSGTTSSTVNGLNQLTAVGSATPTWDAKGNMVSHPSSGLSYGYSSENLLVTYNGGVHAASYDPLMRWNDLIGGTFFSYDGTDRIAEHDASGTLLRRYVHGPGTDEPLVRYVGSGTTDRRFLHADERGSIVALSDGTGAVTNVNTYDEYGRPSATNLGSFQYTGQIWVPDAQVYYYKARFYDPRLGFLQTDPLGYGDGMNMYAYVKGDPVNRRDPSGKQGECADGNCTPIDVFGSRLEVTGDGIQGGGLGGIGGGTRFGKPGCSDQTDTPIETLNPMCEVRFYGAGGGGNVAVSGPTQNTIAEAQRQMIRICGNKQGSHACKMAKEKHRKETDAYNREHPLPPIPEFEEDKPSAWEVITGLAGCIVSVFTPGSWMVNVVGSAGCASGAKAAGEYTIPKQRRR
ncbi:MAG TPA: RHS repeat-associated core domain-containing protein [Allosphingosinicella sp.]|jgi:RHS repeat-associated protein